MIHTTSKSFFFIEHQKISKEHSHNLFLLLHALKPVSQLSHHSFTEVICKVFSSHWYNAKECFAILAIANVDSDKTMNQAASSVLLTVLLASMSQHLYRSNVVTPQLQYCFLESSKNMPEKSHWETGNCGSTELSAQSFVYKCIPGYCTVLMITPFTFLFRAPSQFWDILSSCNRGYYFKVVVTVRCFSSNVFRYSHCQFFIS